MERDKPRPLLRFARQWTLPSNSASNGGAAIIDYPSRHSDSPSPLSGSWVPVTPSPNRPGRRRSLEESIASGSPFPLPPSGLSALTLKGAARHVDASPQQLSCPAPVVASGMSIAEQSVQAVLLDSEADAKSFWRCQAQRLEEKCTALKEELNAAYRLLAKDAAGIQHAQTGSNHTCLQTTGCASPTYETVVRERSVALLELAREREKSFLLRHRLRETEAEVRHLQNAPCDRNASKQCAGAALKRAPPPSNSAKSLLVDHSRNRCSDSRPCSSSRSSAQSTRFAHRSACYPPHRSSTRQGSSPSVRWEESLRPVRLAQSTSSARCRDNCAATRSSIASVSSLTHSEAVRHAATTSAAASATFAGPQSYSTQSPPKPNRQTRNDYEAEARDLLTSLLGMHSSSPNTLQPALCRKDAAQSRCPGPVGQPISKSPHRRVFYSGLFSTGVGVSEENEGGRRPACGTAWGSTKPRQTIRKRRLLWPSPPQRVSGLDHDAYARDPSTDAAQSFREIPLVMRASRNSVDEAPGELSGKETLSRFPEDGQWALWPPHACGSRQRPGGA